MSRQVEKTGNTRTSAFRFGTDTLAELDWLVEQFGAETGNAETRTSVLRQLVRREAIRRKQKEKRA